VAPGDIQALEEVAEDLIEGRNFYDNIEFGVADYFNDSIISNIQSLRFYAGIHSKKYGYPPQRYMPLSFFRHP